MRISICILFLLSGCATINFSANYYTLPDDYQSEAKGLWDEFISTVSLKHTYKFSIVSEKECKKGVPFIEKQEIKVPDNFIKYAYQNYQRDRFVIFSSLIAHELSHGEYNLASGGTPAAHFEVDRKAIEMLDRFDICSADDYYKSIVVLKSYWFARKGVGGHMFNVGWNVLNLASSAYLGVGCFADWFATDLDGRLKLISRAYKVRSGIRFKRSKGIAQ